jgi:hypothetical protein
VVDVARPGQNLTEPAYAITLRAFPADQQALVSALVGKEPRFRYVATYRPPEGEEQVLQFRANDGAPMSALHAVWLILYHCLADEDAAQHDIRLAAETRDISLVFMHHVGDRLPDKDGQSLVITRQEIRSWYVLLSLTRM